MKAATSLTSWAWNWDSLDSSSSFLFQLSAFSTKVLILSIAVARITPSLRLVISALSPWTSDSRVRCVSYFHFFVCFGVRMLSVLYVCQVCVIVPTLGGGGAEG